MAATLPPTRLDSLLLQRTQEAPDAPLYTFLDAEGAPAATLTRAALAARAGRLAQALGQAAAAARPVLVVVGPGQEQPAALFGCFAAGATAVPLYPPPEDNAAAADTIVAVARASGAGHLVTTGAVARYLVPHLQDRLGPAAPEPILLPDAEADPVTAGTGIPGPGPGQGAADAALLLYTSGSTGAPKGVVVTHAALLGNMRAFAAACGRTQDEIVCTWLPHAHIAGLYTRLLPLVLGGRAVVLSPQAFMARPAVWLSAISRHRATLSAAPDFAYALTAQTASDEVVRSLDLSCWTMAISGGEVVRAATIDRFLTRFAGSGLSERAFHPYYGLTETLCTAVPQGEPPVRLPASRAGIARGCLRAPENDADVLTLIGNGAPLGDTAVIAVDPETATPMPPARIGELWARGSAITPGYHQPDGAPSPGDAAATLAEGGGGYFRTGDLGFLHAGQVFVTGRLKELLIVRGKNHYPQDIEATAQAALAELGVRECAAFTVLQDDEEALGLAVEHADAAGVAAAVLRAVRPSIARRHGLAIARAFLLPPGCLPRTATRKIARHACRRLAMSGEWSAYAVAATRRQAQAGHLVPTGRDGALDGLAGPTLAAALLTRLLGLLAQSEGGEIGAEQVDRPIAELGLSSIDLARVAADLRRATGVEPPLTAFFDGSTLRGLARAMADAIAGQRPADPPAAGWRATVRRVALSMPDCRLPPLPPTGAILLTGATGFLGSWLVASLLERGAPDVYCLVRAENPERGLERLERALAKGPGWKESYRGRLHAVPGDVAKPSLGIAADRMTQLAERVTTIVHNAADVNFVAPYAALRATNVEPVHEIVRFAMLGGVARTVHFVSTLAVFNATNRREQRLVRATDRLSEPDFLYSGYAQSKWVAEAAFRIANSRGIPLGIHRPGLVVGDSIGGKAHIDDFLCRFVKGCIELGRYPDAAVELDLVPVDDVAKGIAAAVLQPVDVLETFHWSCPNPVPMESFMSVFRARGHALEKQPVTAWLDHLRTGLAPTNALFAVHPFLLELPPGTDETILELLDGLPHEIDTAEAEALRARSALTATRMTAEVIGKMAAWLEDVAFLPRPAH